MDALPSDFLERISDQYELSDFEKEAFVMKLSNTDKNDIVLSKMLYISKERLRNRMTGVYKKFKINNVKGPGKFRFLQLKVMEIYKKEAPNHYVKVERSETNILVNEAHRKISESIDRNCRTMRVIDTSQPIAVEDVYTEVKILPQLNSNKYIDINDLNADLFDPHKNEARWEKRKSGIDCINDHHKLMILGKPGSGKTTFLKHVAVLCNKREILVDYLPFFIQLRDFSERKNQIELYDYFVEECNKNGIEDIEARQLFNNSRILFLLDGLDEVRDCDKRFVSREIQRFSKDAHENRFIVTCRLAAQERFFEGFTEVEIADFSDQQIRSFAQKWFDLDDNNSFVDDFIQSLNRHIRIRELATNPLLLTLLCLVFSDSRQFPSNRADLYAEGLDVLLKRWDANRGIERSQAYENLSSRRKEDLLSQIAFYTFSRNKLFFRNNLTERIIENYIRNLPSSSTDPESLRLDSKGVLNSIEIQHGLLIERARGIYSFSHLTFHEFFTARKIAMNSDPESQKEALETLVEHLVEKRWEEVFLLVSSTLDEADYLFKLMSKRLRKILDGNVNILNMLNWVNERVLFAEDLPKSALSQARIRRIYFGLCTNKYPIPTRRLGYQSLDIDIQLFSILKIAKALNNYEKNKPSKSQESTVKERLQKTRTLLGKVLNVCIDQLEDNVANKNLINLLRSCKDSYSSRDTWCNEVGNAWLKDFRTTLIEDRNIGYDWEFGSTEITSLDDYNYACRLLFSCLSSDCYIQRETRTSIVNNLYST